MPAILMELRSAARSLARAPTVTLCAVLCLALGIGATTAISSAIDRALLKSLPFRDPEGLVAVFRTTPTSGPQGTWPQSIANYLDMAQRTRRLRALAALSNGTALVGLPGGATQASQLYVTGNLFPMLGVPAARGRFILPDDEAESAPLVAVLSDEFWRTQLGADPAIVGKSLRIDGDPTTVVGIAPRDFRVPVGPNVMRADVWMAARWAPARRTVRRSNFLQLVGRLAPGATVAGADAELRAIHAGIVNAFPELRGEGVRVAAMQSESVQSIRAPLLLLFGAVCAVLLIAATNVAGLLLARGVQRQREQAVRTALGASRWDAMRPALAESLLVTLAGGTLGLALAAAGVRTIGALAAARMPQLEGLGIDLRVALFALLLSLVVAVVCGALPAWRGAAVDPQDALRGARGAGGARSQHRALRSLVVVEIALSLMLLIGAGLVLKGFAGLLRNDPGFETAHVLTLRVTVPAASYADRSAVAAFLEPALEQVRTIPRVERVAAITAPPYVTWGNNGNVRYEGRPADDPSRQPLVEFRSVTPDYFAVTGQRLLGGRLLRAADDERPETPAVVVVNQALVDRDFHGVSPVGTRWHTSDTTYATIVGVVSNVRNAGPIAPPAPEMYFTYRQNGFGSSTFPLLLRVRGDDPAAVAAEVRRAVTRVDPSAAISQVSPMPEVMQKALGRPRFYFSLLGTFAAVAMLLAVAGLYGVLSYAVAQRTRELGIRTALGSTAGGLVSLVARNGLALVGTGIVLGMAGGAAVTRLMSFMLYGVSPLDPVAWALAALLMVLGGAAASLVPALRATRVDPTIAMRAE